MSLTLPTHGEQGWDVKLNAALTALDAMDSTLAGQITAAITAAASDATAKVAAEVTARNAAITSAVNALVAGAPGALDTLVELATQLATDESAATTLTSLVGTKAPLASPALTGTPTAPTATGGTNTTQVATTAFTTAAVAAEATARASADAAEVTARNAAIATASATSQPLDADLTTIAALDASTAGVLSTDGSGWIRKTYAQLKTALALVKADVGLGNVDNTSDVNKPVSTAQATADALALAKASNLSDVASATTARTNLAAAPILAPTALKTAPYAVAVGELALMNVAGGAVTLTLPTAPADKAQIAYRAIGATTAVPMVINAGGSDTIGTTGLTTASIPLADEVGILQYQAASTRWLAVSNVKTLASLDARYPLLSTVTTKGDLLAATAAGALSRLGVGSNTQVLTADSTAATGVKWATPASGSGVPPQSIKTGSVTYHLFGSGASAFALTAGEMRAVPFPVDRACTVDRISCYVSSAAASSNVRLGIYADDGNGRPGALLLDAGTVDSSTTGLKEIIISQALTSGLYHTVAVAQGGTPGLYLNANPVPGYEKQVTAINNMIQFSHYGSYQVSVTGALPNPFVPVTSDGPSPGVRVALRIT